MSFRAKPRTVVIYPQSRWSGSGWDKGRPTGPKIPYRLPELVAAPGQPVFICEGEKCADAVAELGWLATSASEGAGKWKAELNRWFTDRVVYVLADNDKPGIAHADMLARNLHGVAREVRIVKLEPDRAGSDHCAQEKP
jgi:DNA primase